MSENSEILPEKIEFTPIGYVENDYLKPEYNEEIYEKVSKIVVKKEFEEGLYRVEELEKLYILFYFSRSEGYKLIHRRRYDGEIAGVFASRSPYRPNGIGLTLVELLKVEDNIIHVKGLDAINGTPVLDIKPYIKEIEETDQESKSE